MAETPTGGEGAPAPAPASPNPQNTENRTAGFERPEDYDTSRNPTRPKTVLTNVTSNIPEGEGSPLFVIHLPQFVKKDVKEYTKGFIKPGMAVATAPKEKYLVGFTGRTSQERIVAQNQQARQVVLEIERAEKAGGAFNADSLFAWLNYRIHHKFREVAGEDPNVSGRLARHKAWLELRKLEMWRDTVAKLSSGEIQDPKEADRYVKSQHRKLLLEVLTSFAWEKSVRDKAVGVTLRRGRRIDENAVSANAASRKAERQAVTDSERAQRDAEREAGRQRRQQERENRQNGSPQPETPAPPTPDTGQPTPPPPSPQVTNEEELNMPAERQERMTQAIRLIADQIIMHHFPVDQIIAMNAEGKTKEEIDKAFIEAAKQYLQKITIHRKSSSSRIDQESGERQIFESGDLDGESAVGLLRMAGIKVRVNFVNAGEYTPGELNIDTGMRPGIEIGAEGENTQYEIDTEVPPTLTAFADHHGKFAPRDVSGTYLTYELLTHLGLLEKTPSLDKAVWLVNELDNGRLPKQHYAQSYQTIWGLADFMRMEDIVDYYQNGGRIYDELTPEQLAKYGLVIPEKNIDRTRERKNTIDRNLRGLEGAKKGRRIFTTPFGKILVAGNVDWQARGEDFDVSVRWDNENRENLTVVSERDFPPDLISFFEQNGIPVVKPNMAVKASIIIPGRINFTLGDLLARLGITNQDLANSRYVQEEVTKDNQRR